jgi:hypothetical protein
LSKFVSKFSDFPKIRVMFRKVLVVRKIFLTPKWYTDRNIFGDLYSIHDKEDLRKALKNFKEIEEKIVEENEKSPRNGDQPLGALFAQNGWLPNTALKRTVDWWYLDFEFAVKPAEISVRHFSGLPQANDIITDSRGNKGIIDHLAQNITSKIKTEKVVKQIKYDSSGIEVRTKDGEIFKAKHRRTGRGGGGGGSPPSFFGQSGNIRSTVGQFWFEIKKMGQILSILAKIK